jgi:TolA-binding protein
VVPYQLADILIRLAPASADDAVAAGKLEEQLRGAIELLEGFATAQPNGPLTADALLKLGHCQQRLAKLLAQPPDQAKALAAARAAYEQILQRFPRHEAQPVAVFERAKCLALGGDVNGAVNELRRFANDPLKNAGIAPMALLHLATLLRGQNRAGEAADVLAKCRKDHEPSLAKDPARAGWVTLLQYHHGVALRESGRRPEARAVFELIVRQAPDRPEAADAALRWGQCLKDEGQQKIAEATKRLAQPNVKPEVEEAARKLGEEGAHEVREAVRYLVAQADRLKQKQPGSEARAASNGQSWCP